ncbi:DUF6232 family protein [Photobacterium alginatilyticum]|uniref:DUF4231 domain-containing protein n=1 Tax=Photobacterium alginatilyticum TaxID=1775171 RepID=A0ABW9YR87_9GAMM|nr:DUF6232 family protein [Photobacterium alginatilyticum]NBI56218.1 hypothetical protein [Photobacterium alginatilyticum]
MINTQDFKITDNNFRFQKDDYKLSRIRDVRVKQNAIKDHLFRLMALGLVFSGIVWVICPEGFGYIMAPIAFIIGLITALISSRKYELQIEFQHIDETGIQWISVAKANKLSEMTIFKEQAQHLKQIIT